MNKGPQHTKGMLARRNGGPISGPLFINSHFSTLFQDPGKHQHFIFNYKKPKDTFIPQNIYWPDIHYINSSVIIRQTERHGMIKENGKTLQLDKLHINRGKKTVRRDALKRTQHTKTTGGRSLFHSPNIASPPTLSIFSIIKKRLEGEMCPNCRKMK